MKEPDEAALQAAEEKITEFLNMMIDPLPDAQHVYFISAGREAVKIGFATDVEDRLSRMRSYNHMPLELLGVIPFGRCIEQPLHVKFWHLHIDDLGVRGEWFHLNKELSDWITEHSEPEVPYWLERHLRTKRLWKRFEGR